MIFANTRSRPPARIERLALRLSQFDYEIVHEPGATNAVDYYLRHPLKSTKMISLRKFEQALRQKVI